MEAATVNGNGAAPELVALPTPPQGYRAYYEEQAMALTQAAVRAEAEAEQAREVYEKMVSDAKKLRRAADILTGEASSTPARGKRTSGGRGGAKGPGWSMSEAKLQQVWNLVRENGEEQFTAASLSKGSGISPDTAGRALSVLRERELVRMVGTGRGGGKILTIMPGAENLDAKGR